jgi:hypothetical protein
VPAGIQPRFGRNIGAIVAHYARVLVSGIWQAADKLFYLGKVIRTRLPGQSAR